jgi:hypothetical protein
MLSGYSNWAYAGSCSRPLLQQQQQLSCTALLHAARIPPQQHYTHQRVALATPADKQQAEDPQQEPWSSSSSSSNTRQQQGSKDSPDLGRRTRRQVKVPLPKRPSQSSSYTAAGPATAADFAAAADAAAEGIDPEAPGFTERAFLMGFLESMDPSTRAQFEQYMANQLQQVEFDQQQASAVDFLQAALDKVADKALNPEQPDDKTNNNSNSGQLFEGPEAEAVMWQSLRGGRQHASAVV